MKKKNRNYRKEIISAAAVVSAVIILVVLIIAVVGRNRVDECIPDIPDCELPASAEADSNSGHDAEVSSSEEGETVDIPAAGYDSGHHSDVEYCYGETENDKREEIIIPSCSDDWKDIAKLREERKSKICDYLLHDGHAFRLEALGVSFIAFLILILTWICTVIARRPKTVVKQTIIENELPDDLLRKGDVIESVGSDFESELYDKYDCPNTGHATFIYWVVKRIESGEDFSKHYADDALKLLIEGRIRDIRDYDMAAEYFRCNPLPGEMVVKIIKQLTEKDFSSFLRNTAIKKGFNGSDTL